MTTLTNKKILDSLKDKETRELFAEEHISTGLPFQIHGLREKLGLTQAELARRAGMAQERISVLEDPNYEFLPKIPTLIKLANVFDVPLIVKFGSWLELFNWETNLSPELLAPKSFDEELGQLEEVASLTTTYAAPVRSHLVPGTLVGRRIEIPGGSVTFTPRNFVIGNTTLYVRYRGNTASNLDELVAAAVGEGAVSEVPDPVLGASQIMEETDTSVTDFFPVSNTNIIDYSAQEPF